MAVQNERPLANMMADPVGRVIRASEGSWPATGIQSEGGLYDPLATLVAVAFIGELDEDRNQLAIVEQHQCVAVRAVGSEPNFIG